MSITPCPHTDDHPEFRARIDQLEAMQMAHGGKIDSLMEFMANIKGFLIGVAGLAAGIGAVVGVIARGLGK